MVERYPTRSWHSRFTPVARRPLELSLHLVGDGPITSSCSANGRKPHQSRRPFTGRPALAPDSGFVAGLVLSLTQSIRGRRRRRVRCHKCPAAPTPPACCLSALSWWTGSRGLTTFVLAALPYVARPVCAHAGTLFLIPIPMMAGAASFLRVSSAAEAALAQSAAAALQPCHTLVTAGAQLRYIPRWCIGCLIVPFSKPSSIPGAALFAQRFGIHARCHQRFPRAPRASTVMSPHDPAWIRATPS